MMRWVVDGDNVSLDAIVKVEIFMERIKNFMECLMSKYKQLEHM